MDAGRSTRRKLLALAGAGVSTALAGCSLSGGDGGGNATTTPVGEKRARELAEAFAPTLYFDTAETWFPTDPRPYATENNGERVVHGFDAVEGYLQEFEPGDPPTVPAPTVFYNAVSYESSPLDVVQFWMYSAFDQFTANFHWHDWEVLHVFVDAESDEPPLYVASSHSRRVPNNEHLDPEASPRILTELGSHSSALSVNSEEDSFQRVPGGDDIADVTNAAVTLAEAIAEFPLAYGLPRDEGFRLPYVVPELDGEPVYEHPELPSFDRTHLVPPELTVRSYDSLDSPPDELPVRKTGTRFGVAEAADVTYDLVSTAEAEAIDAFEGPQLSFEFSIPEFAEDAVASHITTAGTPWKQDRYADPAADITDPNHRAALADRYEAVGPGGAAARIVGALRDVVPDEAAPDGSGVTPAEPVVEAVALLESDPAAVPSFVGVVAADADPGEHRLTINGAGRKPHSEQLQADEGTTAAGADGRLSLVANEDATKLRIDTEGTEETLDRIAVEDDFGGKLYETRVDGPDATYIHREGAYTTEVEDTDGSLGAFRTNPEPDGDGSGVTVERPETGKASLASFVADLAVETRDDVQSRMEASDSDDDETGGGRGGRTTSTSAGDGQGGPAEGLARALDAVAASAGRAAERARKTDAQGANERLETVQRRLGNVRDALENVREAGAIPEPVTRAVERRLENLNRRVEQALDEEKL